jgi:hypothetical protein
MESQKAVYNIIRLLTGGTTRTARRKWVIPADLRKETTNAIRQVTSLKF